MISSLSIRPTEEIPFVGGIWTRIIDDIQLIHGVSARTVEPVLRKSRNWSWSLNPLSKQFAENCQSTWLRLTMLLQPLFSFPQRWVCPFLLRLACPLSSLLKDTSLLNAPKLCHQLSSASPTRFP